MQQQFPNVNDPQMKHLQDLNRQQMQQMVQGASSGFTALIVGIGVCVVIVVGIPLVLAGIGVIKRREWGRILALILSGLSVLFALLVLYQAFVHFPPPWQIWINFVLYAVYGVGSFVILLHPRFAAEFG